jgi:hypothetical protein
MNFKLFKKFRVRTGLTDLRSNRLIAPLFPNRPELHFVQGMIHCDLQSLHYHLDNMRTPYPKIEEDNEITKVLLVKQNLETPENLIN